MKPDYLPEYFRKPIIVLGCGNSLRGDDGFGPMVIDRLQKNYKIPEDVYILDIGTAIRSFLFDLNLCEQKPKKIIIVDSIDQGKTAGEIFELLVDEYLPAKEISDKSLLKEIWIPSLHDAPTFELLKRLRDSGEMEIIVLLCQAESIPREIKIGLSKPVEKAVDKMCNLILQKYARTERIA